MPLRRITLIALTAAAALAAVGAGPPAADAATTCRFANDVVEVHMTQHRDHALLRATAGPIDIDGPAGPVACSGGTPTTSNTDAVVVFDDSDNLATAAGNDGNTRVSIREPTAFGPGKTAEPSPATSEIEFYIDTKHGYDSLTIAGQSQKLFVGNDGLSWTTDSDADMVGMSFDDVRLTGSEAFDRFSGQGGNGTGAALSTANYFGITAYGAGDYLQGSDIATGDVINAGDGSDTIEGGAGDDLLRGQLDDDMIEGGPGSDTVLFDTESQPVTVDLSQTGAQDTGAAGRDTLAELENAVGTSHADRLTGDAGANMLDGGEGDDALEGRGGADDLRGGPGADAVSYAQAPAGVTLDLARTTQATDGDKFNSIEDLVGSPFADTLTGNTVANRIVGGPGADTLAAGDGADRVEIRDGEGDRVSCGADADTAISDHRSVDAVDGDCETVDALPEPAEPEGQPTDPTTADAIPDTALSFSLSGASRQRLLRQRAVRVKVSCPLEACTTVASGSGRLRAVASSRLPATRLKLGPRTTRVAAGTTGTVRLSLTRKQLSALRKALAAGQRLKVKVTVRARDAADNTVERTLRLTARR